MSKIKNLFYPAIFHKEDDGGYWVSFPNVPAALTQGETMDEAVQMSKEALGLALFDYEEKEKEFPPAVDPMQIEVDASEGEFVFMLELDYLQFKKKYFNKSVSKNVSLPEWLRDLAEEENINYSYELQEALKKKLGV